MNMAPENGYSGDEDIRGNVNGQNCNPAQSDSSTCSLQPRDTRSQFFAEIPRRSDGNPKHLREHFFGDIPPRQRKRRRMNGRYYPLAPTPAPSVQQFVEDAPPIHTTKETLPCSKTTSLYYNARWLNQYFLNQTATITSGSTTPDKIPEEITMDKHTVPLVSSSRHVLVEEAISFSPHPRALIESDNPHRVVHTNAAYMRRYGTSNQSSFTAPHVESHHDLEAAVCSLFESNLPTDADSLIMYPVSGCNKEADGTSALVTHYLIEANNNISPPVETITSPANAVLLHKTNSTNQWRTQPAHAIA